MFLKQLKLQNVRCFESLEIGFDLEGGNNRKWTVILGENGTGKSTVLRSAALLLAGSDALLDLLDNPADWVRHDASEAVISGVIETQEGEAREISLVIGRKEPASVIVSRSIETLGPLNAALANTERSYFVAAYGGLRRLNSGGLTGKTAGFRNQRAQNVATLFSRDAELNPIESWAMTLDYNLGDEGISTVAEVLSDFLGEVSFSRIDKKNRTLLFNTPDGELPLQQLSDGYQNIAAWVGDLLFRITETFGDYKNPLNARGLLIIDEVAVHLHPKWQRRLLTFLNKKFPKMQLVVTTHSASVAQQADEGSLFYIARDEGGVNIHPFEGDPGRLLVNQLLMTEAFGNSSDESLEVETLKDQYRTLYRKESKDDSDAQEMKKISDQIGQRPIEHYQFSAFTIEQRALLDKISKVRVEEDEQ